MPGRPPESHHFVTDRWQPRPHAPLRLDVLSDAAEIPAIVGAILGRCRSRFRLVQRALKQDGLDGWLLYDFQGRTRSPPACRAGRGGEDDHPPVVLPHPCDRRAARAGARHRALQPRCACPARRRPYAGREQLAAGSRDCSAGRTGGDGILARQRHSVRLRVDAGTVEAVRALGVEVVSSGDLIQRFEAVWTDEAYATHRAASDKLYRVKDQAFALFGSGSASATPSTEFDVQQAMVEWFEAEGLTSHRSAQRLGAGERRQPALQPHPGEQPRDQPDELVLIDLWGKLPEPGAVFADIAWVGFTGATVPATYATPSPRPGPAGTPRSQLVESAARADASCAATKSTGSAARSSNRPGSGPVHPSDRPQPGPRRPRRRGPHGRLRNPRRPSPDPRHRLYDRTRRLYGSVRGADRDQHVRLRARGAGQRPPPEAIVSLS